MSFFDNNNITADASKANKSFTPIPEGTYSLLIEKCEEKNSKNGDPMLSIKFKVENTEYAGRFLFETIMLGHPNQQVVEIGHRKLHTLLIACGIKQPKSADEFLGKSVEFKVKVVKDKGTGEMRNEVVFAQPSSKDASAPTPATTSTKPARKAGGDW